MEGNVFEEKMEGNVYSNVYNLGMDFTLEGGMEEAVSVDLEGEWGMDTVISRHPGFKEPNLVFVSGEVGDGGDHMNILFKNVSDQPVTIKGSTVVAELRPKNPVDCLKLSPTRSQHPGADLELALHAFYQDPRKESEQKEETQGGATEANQTMVGKTVDTIGHESRFVGIEEPGDNNVYFSNTYAQIFRRISCLRRGCPCGRRWRPAPDELAGSLGGESFPGQDSLQSQPLPWLSQQQDNHLGRGEARHCEPSPQPTPC